jgi:hypothetical protein
MTQMPLAGWGKTGKLNPERAMPMTKGSAT